MNLNSLKDTEIKHLVVSSIFLVSSAPKIQIYFGYTTDFSDGKSKKLYLFRSIDKFKFGNSPVGTIYWLKMRFAVSYLGCIYG